MKKSLLNINVVTLKVACSKLLTISLFTALLVCVSSVKATTYYSMASGAWTSGSTWSTTGPSGPTCSCTPPSGGNSDIVIIEPGDDVTYTGSFTLGNSCTLTVSAGASLNITGVFTMGNSATLNDNGTFTSGGLALGNSAGINVASGAHMTINGNLTAGNSASATINGAVTVNGNTTLGNSANISGTGSLNTTGTFSTGNSGSVFGAGSASCTNCTLSSGGTTVYLPISLISYTAVYQNNVVLLKWSTATETSNKYFTIDRSTDGENFTELTTINGADNSSTQHNYSYTDESPTNGVSYYRLKQTDYDGNYTYLGIDAVNADIIDKVIKIAPNPAQNNCVISFYDNMTENSQMSVYDCIGREVVVESITAVKGSNSVELDISTLAKGMYFISLQVNGSMLKAKFIKN